ncbi:ribonuclease HII [Tribonema minus]|uniref:Ribonuclease n=1 Tax=Tribonema minus TaxID=303371 RepID=A0A836CBR9_9STRA|nr:ribonuclease HII [Tribonema minus]
MQVGVDEVGRGCLLGFVAAAAVILPSTYPDEGWMGIKDSKKLSAKKREQMATYIKNNALAYGIGTASVQEIDEHNILQAVMLAMHRALDQVAIPFESIAVDGTYFNPYRDVPHECIVKGDSTILSIAAASIIAKEFRDNAMRELVHELPDLAVYDICNNMGYGTPAHIEGIRRHGITDHHRKSFKVKSLS